MALMLALALQATAAPAPPLLDIDFDLARYDQPGLGLDRRDCERGDSSTIVVCARRGGGDYPLARMSRIYGPGPPLVAETRLIGNLVGDVHLEQVQPRPADRGAVANRVMVGLRLPF